MALSHRHLMAFLTVADLRSFTAAARALHLTQGAVSALVKDLEDYIGVVLFDRTSRSVRVSQAGNDFLPYARRAVMHVQSAERFANDMRNQRAGHVRIVGAPLIACTLLPRLLADFSRAHPTIRISTVDIPMGELQAVIASGDADIGLGPDRLLENEITSSVLFSTPVSVICPPHHRFADGTTWAELRDEPIIVVGEEMINYIAWEFGDPRFTVAMVVNHISTALSFAAVGRGVVLAGPFVSQLAAAYGLRVCPLGNPVLQRKMMIYSHEGSSFSPAVSTLMAFLKDHIDAIEPNAIF